MGKLKNLSNKSLQFLNDEPETTTSHAIKDSKKKKQKSANHIFVQQSVTLLALKDKAINNGTVAPDVVQPKLFFGIINEDLPIFVGAVIGASLIIALALLVLTLWKCCCRLTILSKKKEYWLEPKNSSSYKGKHKIPVVQSNSVVFLGLKPTHIFDYKRERSSEDCRPFSTLSEKDYPKTSLSGSQHIKMLAQSSELTANESEQGIFNESSGLPTSHAENNVKQICSVISVPPITNTIVSHVSKPSFISPHDIPSVIIHRDSPALFHRNFYSGTFDQHSLYSCESHVESEFDLKTCSLTWSNYSLRPSSSDCYNDLFQKATICKKRKNRMRSDIAAAIALNRSQSSQLNKDTELLVENEVEIVLDERTTL